VDKYPQLQTRLLNASKIVNSQLAKLRILHNKFSLLDKELKLKVILNLKKGDKDKANVIAQELVQIRNIKNTTRKLSLTLEIIAIRFSTVSEFAQILDTINPMIETVKEVKTEISNTIPEARRLFSEMSSLTNDVLINTNIDMNSDPISFHVDSDVLDILHDVQSLIEDQTRNKLPEVPNVLRKEKKLSKDEISEEGQAVLI
jgi:division protein CdvB (Snf7/Vps24/ESCRT-III family)